MKFYINFQKIEESFAALIAVIFIKESIFKLVAIRKTKVYSNDPLNYYTDYVSNPSCFKCVRSSLNGSSSNISSSSLMVSDDLKLSAMNESECASLGAGYEFIKNCKYSPDVFYVSVFLYALTFFLAMTLRTFRTSRFFPTFVSFFEIYALFYLYIQTNLRFFFLLLSDPLKSGRFWCCDHNWRGSRR